MRVALDDQAALLNQFNECHWLYFTLQSRILGYARRELEHDGLAIAIASPFRGGKRLAKDHRPANSSQQPTRGRSLVRRFRALCFVNSGGSLAGT